MKSHQKGKLVQDGVPPTLRPRLESARLDLRALFRATDRLRIAQHLPPELRRLMELDADFAECLHVLDKPAKGFSIPLMMQDTLASLNRVERVREEFLITLADDERDQLVLFASGVRDELGQDDAYLDIPGRDPRVPARP